MHTCIHCNGSKQMTILLGDAGTKMQIGCVHCKQVGSVIETEATQIAQRDAFAAMWCTCENGQHSYVPDHGSIKHHWTCDGCGLLVQVG